MRSNICLYSGYKGGVIASEVGYLWMSCYKTGSNYNYFFIVMFHIIFVSDNFFILFFFNEATKSGSSSHFYKADPPGIVWVILVIHSHSQNPAALGFPTMFLVHTPLLWWRSCRSFIVYIILDFCEAEVILSIVFKLSFQDKLCICKMMSCKENLLGRQHFNLTGICKSCLYLINRIPNYSNASLFK